MLLYRFLPSQCLHEERLLPIAEDPGIIWEFGRCWSFFMPRPKIWILANQDEWVIKTVHCIHRQQFKSSECDHIPFGLCNAPAIFQWLMKNCLRELSLIYCLIYLDNIVVFSQTAEEHLHCLQVVFDQFREHNLKLKPLKCNLFREEITYLVHEVLKEGVWPSNLNLTAIAEGALLQTYTEVCGFFGLVGHYRRFIKRFTHIVQLLSEHLAGEEASRKSE